MCVDLNKLNGTPVTAQRIRINENGIHQRNAQRMEEKYSEGPRVYLKEDIIQLMKEIGGFFSQAPLMDICFNLHQMSTMQQQQLVSRASTFTHLYGGMALTECALVNGPGSPGQPPKFYAPLPLLPQMGDMDPDELREDIMHFFRMGMPRLDLGRYLIRLGCPIDLRKVSKQMQQSRERGEDVSNRLGEEGLLWMTSRFPPSTTVLAAKWVITFCCRVVIAMINRFRSKN